MYFSFCSISIRHVHGHICPSAFFFQVDKSVEYIQPIYLLEKKANNNTVDETHGRFHDHVTQIEIPFWPTKFAMCVNFTPYHLYYDHFYATSTCTACQLRPEENDRQFTDEIFKSTFPMKWPVFCFKVHRTLFPRIPIDNKRQLIQIVAWCQTDGGSLSGGITAQFATLRPRQNGRLLQTFSNAFSWMKMYEFRLMFHWSLFIRVQLTIFQHWFR